jgi:hypothetical protein
VRINSEKERIKKMLALTKNDAALYYKVLKTLAPEPSEEEEQRELEGICLFFLGKLLSHHLDYMRNVMEHGQSF